MQPSEIDKLSTYEFNKYMDLLEKSVKADRELAQAGRLNSLFNI